MCNKNSDKEPNWHLKMYFVDRIVALSGALLLLTSCDDGNEGTKASESRYNNDISLATSSDGLSAADLAWHALNTYGWDCDEVTNVEEEFREGYYLIQCSSGMLLRVYPRQNRHPRITNEDGGFD